MILDNGSVPDTTFLPGLQLAGDGGPVLGDDHDEEVAVLAVRGEHRTLLAHLAPVAARASQAQRGQRDIVHARLGELHADPGQVVHRDRTRLAGQVTSTKSLINSKLWKGRVKTSGILLAAMRDIVCNLWEYYSF